MNGAPLSTKHGFPARLIVPGVFGMKNAKWVQRVELVDADFVGYWQRQGWSDAALYRTTSRVDAPRRGERPRPSPMVVQGIAFGGDRGIRAVEVSADGGATWRAAQLRAALGPFSWVRWSIDWPLTPGARAKIVVRAIDGSGNRQVEAVAPPFPDGATGLHAVEVRALDA
jgi:hypothetical protein